MRGTFMNYLAATNLTTGELPGGLTPSGPTGVLYHAKPVIIQGAWLAARADGSYADFQAFQPAMQALLAYWQRAPRVDAATGLPLWHDQLETGADNLVFSECPSAYSPDCWVEAADAYTLSSPDLLVFLAREELAFANFCEAWAGVRSPDEPLTAASLRSTATQHRERASALRDLLNTYLWHWDDPQHTRGWYCAYNVSSRQQIRNRTYQMAWPLWANMTASSAQVAASVAAVRGADMLTPYGIRSASATDPRYSNANIIDPYSNWRGPIWINANAVLAYSLRSQGYEQAAAQLADAVVALLANDLVVNDGQWHECYDADNGTALAAPGFLSWNTLGATLQANVAAGVDPFSLDGCRSGF
jgi:hypothetical protein